MIRYIMKRLLMAVIVVIGVAFVVFSIMSFTPSSPGRLILGSRATDEEVEAVNRELGYDKPFLIRFGNWLLDAVTKLDFGKSYRTGQPVFREIFAFYPTTIKLAAYAVILTTVLGVPLGILAAVKHNSIYDNIATTASVILSVAPSFWLSLLFIRLFALKLKWFPINGAESFLHYVLPTLALGITSVASILRMTRSSMLDAINQEYVRTAKGKGCTQYAIIWKHSLKNALLPIIIPIGSLFAEMLGGTIIIETVFVMPGLGSHIMHAIHSKDIPVILAATTLLAASYSLIILVMDVMFAYIDPRVKAKYTSLRGKN